MRYILAAASLCAVAADARAAENFETVTSVTTYSTRQGINKDASPAFVLDTGHAATYKPDPVVTEISRQMAAGARAIQTRGTRAVTLVRDSSSEARFTIIKSIGVVAIGGILGPEAAAYFVGYAGVMGVYKPWERTITHALDVEDLSNLKPGSAKFSAVVASIGRDGRPIIRGYKSLATNRSGPGDLFHYTLRGVYSPTSRPYFLAYIANEIVSFYSGKGVELFGGGKAMQEAIGSFVGSAAEDQYLAHHEYMSQRGERERYATIDVASSSGGFRPVILPSVIRAAPRAASAQPAVIAAARAAEGVPYAVDRAISTFRSQGVASVAVAQPSSSVAVVTPHVSTTSAGETAPISGDRRSPSNSSDHSVDLPSSVEIHGLGSFRINR